MDLCSYEGGLGRSALPPLQGAHCASAELFNLPGSQSHPERT